MRLFEKGIDWWHCLHMGVSGNMEGIGDARRDEGRIGEKGSWSGRDGPYKPILVRKAEWQS